jgi:hypothetical protein
MMIIILNIIIIIAITIFVREHAMAQLVEVLLYKPGGHGFHSR